MTDWLAESKRRWQLGDEAAGDAALIGILEELRLARLERERRKLEVEQGDRIP